MRQARGTSGHTFVKHITMNRLVATFLMMFLGVLASTPSVASLPLTPPLACESLFKESVIGTPELTMRKPRLADVIPLGSRNTVKSPMSFVPGTRIYLNVPLFAETKANGYFEVYERGTNTLVFDSKPNLFRWAAFRRTPKKVRGEVPSTLMLDSSEKFLIHTAGDFTKFDVWAFPLGKSEPRIVNLGRFVHNGIASGPLYGYRDDVQQWKEFGAIKDRQDSAIGYLDEMKLMSEGISGVAFHVSKNRPGIVYVLYEHLSSWTGYPTETGVKLSPYYYQEVVLIEMDLISNHGTKLGVYKGPDANITHLGNNRIAHDENARYTRFSMRVEDDSAKTPRITVLAHASDRQASAILFRTFESQ